MGLFSWFRRGGGSSGSASASVGSLGAVGERQQVLDREAGPADLEHLRLFVATRSDVEFYVEPETTATDTTVMAVAGDGEWTRRRVGSPKRAEKLARKCKVPIWDVQVTGYPQAMRDWNARAKADREKLRAWDRELRDGTDGGLGRSGH